jgi:hypothetical protein
VYWGGNGEFWRPKGGGDTVGATEVESLKDAQQVVQASRATCALEKGGTVDCWHRATRKKWTVANVPDAVRIAVGTEMGCAVLKSGAMRCWRDEAPGNEPLQAPPKATDVAIGEDDDICALGPKGIQCWRPFAGDALDAGTSLKNPTQITVGSHHACARLSNGTAWCWGANGHGQIGDGTTEVRTQPTQVKDLAKVRQVAAVGESTCALLEDGTARCWGRDTDGYLGVQRFRAQPHEPRKVAF